MANEVDEIKSRLDVVDVVSEYVRLKQGGTNWKAKSFCASFIHPILTDSA